MNWLNDFFPQLIELELYQPDLVSRLRLSPHITMLGKHEFFLDYWQTSQLNFFVGPATRAYDDYLKALGLPLDLLAALNQKPVNEQRAWYWPTSIGYDERLEWVQLADHKLSLRYFTRRHNVDMQLSAPPLSAEQQTLTADWLAQPETIQVVIDSKTFDFAALKALNLIPTWSELTLTHSAKKHDPTLLAPGVRFVCRALALYPALLLIWRGVNGREVLRRFIEHELAQRQADLETARGTLPTTPSEFWAAPDLPLVPDPEQLSLDEGLGAYLTTPNFWKKPDDNELFMNVMGKVYKNIPRKLKKIYQTNRRYD